LFGPGADILRVGRDLN